MYDSSIHVDPNSKLLMAPDGMKPANPFQDEPQFEESLQMNFHPGKLKIFSTITIAIESTYFPLHT